MASSLYKRWLKLFEVWPIDATKTGRDLGEHIRKKVLGAYKHGETTTIENLAECEKDFASLQRLSRNIYANKYPTKLTGASYLTVEECRDVVSSSNLKRMNVEDKELSKKLSNKFSQKVS